MLGVHDLFYGPDAGKNYTKSWFWCRKHGRIELGEWAQIGCIRVGPLMNEGEAARVGEALG